MLQGKCSKSVFCAVTTPQRVFYQKAKHNSKTIVDDLSATELVLSSDVEQGV